MDPIKKYYRSFAYATGFFLAIHMAFPAYFNSAFLGRFMAEGNVGLIFALASFLSIVALSNITKLLGQLGKRKIIYLGAIVNALLTLPLIWLKSPLAIVTIFLIYYSVSLVVKFVLDLYLEDISTDGDTGKIRGLYMTAINTAWLLSPLLASRLIEETGFSAVYLLSAAALLPVIFVMIFRAKEFNTAMPPRISIKDALIRLVSASDEKNKNLYNILAIDFLLNLFYAVMVIYTALYLENHIGLAKSGIGIAFTIMLIPFVIFDYPLGRIADKWLGEKEILIIGLVFMGLATLIIPIISTTSVLVWALLLLATRIGAASVEIMKETYLFKKIDGQDADIICVSRNMQPVSYIIGPILGSIFISLWGIQYIFILIGLLMLFGITFALKLRDTK